MATLTYVMITSADGYTASADGTFTWAMPSAAAHRHAGDLASELAGEIYGPRMWETMKFWQDVGPHDGVDYGELTHVMHEYAQIWQSQPHYVFSRAEGNPLTREGLRELKAASDGKLGISGPGLAALALEWGEVDEVARYIVPVTVGGGTPWWPAGVEAQLELLEHQEIDAGWVFLRYAVLHP